MAYKRKQRILKIIRNSVLTGKAVWVSHRRSYQTEWKAYKQACLKEINRMRQWANIINRRKRNVASLLGKLTESLPILGDMPPVVRDAAKSITLMASNEPSKHSDFYDHLQEEKRRKRNARKRQERWQKKYGNKN